MKTRTSYDDQMCKIFHDYSVEHGHEPVDITELFNWATERNRWCPRRRSPLSMFRSEMGKALRSEKIADENGLPVRRNHAFKVKDGQQVFHWWTDILTVKPEHMKMSMQQRLLVLAAGAVQHDRDARYYNDHNEFGAQLTFDYNLAPHVENAQHPAEYPEERPEDEQDEEDAS